MTFTKMRSDVHLRSIRIGTDASIMRQPQKNTPTGSLHNKRTHYTRTKPTMFTCKREMKLCFRFSNAEFPLTHKILSNSPKKLQLQFVINSCALKVVLLLLKIHYFLLAYFVNSYFQTHSIQRPRSAAFCIRFLHLYRSLIGAFNREI